jgi:hypothetical protein
MKVQLRRNFTLKIESNETQDFMVLGKRTKSYQKWPRIAKLGPWEAPQEEAVVVSLDGANMHYN